MSSGLSLVTRRAPANVFTVTWAVENFYGGPGRTLKSKKFNVPSFPKLWWMEYYTSSHTFQIFCEKPWFTPRPGPEEQAKYTITFYVLHPNGNTRIELDKSGWFPVANPPVSSLVVRVEKRLRHDVFEKLARVNKVTCIAEFTIYDLNDPFLAGPFHPPQTPSANSFSSDISRFINQLPKDLNILTRDKECIQAHCVVLMARSKIFQAMLSPEFEEKKEMEIRMPNYYKSTISAMLEFLYTDRVDNLAPRALSLLMLADEYGLKDLFLMCRRHLIQNIDLKNVGQILIAASTLKDETLKKYAIEYFCSMPLASRLPKELKDVFDLNPIIHQECLDARFKFGMNCVSVGTSNDRA